MRVKKVLWVIIMTALIAVLMFVIGFRQRVYDKVILGGSEDVFVDAGKVSEPLDGYSGVTDTADKGATGAVKVRSDLTFPNITIEDWNFTVISRSVRIKDYTPSVAEFGDSGVILDSRIIANISQLIRAAHNAGFDPHISCSYISYTSQQQMMNEKATELMESEGCSYTEARELAKQYIEEPGTSDHQTGMAIDITDGKHEVSDYSEMDPEFFAWLDEHCAEFGFIKRYPSEKKGITGRDEPCHYRYVGIAAAEFIMQNGLCLEEFVAHYEYQK